LIKILKKGEGVVMTFELSRPCWLLCHDSYALSFFVKKKLQSVLAGMKKNGFLQWLGLKRIFKNNYRF